MAETHVTLDDPHRIAALLASGLMDKSIDPTLERLTQFVRTVLNVPVALVSLVDADRQFFKSHCGLPQPWADRRETPLSHSICQHVVMSGQPLLIPDTRQNALVTHNLAVCDIGVVAYAGVPIVGDTGHVLGALCAIDGKPRTWSDEDERLLKALSLQISCEVQLRSQSAKLAAEVARQEAAEERRRSVLRLDVHDLRTPLSALLLGLDTLPVLGPLNDEQTEFLALAKRNGQALLGIVNTLLDIDAVEQKGAAAFARKPWRAATLVTLAAEQTRPLAVAKKLSFTTHVDPAAASVEVDGDRIVRVLINLIGNAIKFTDAGTVDVTVTPDGDATRFRVQDSGIGMQDAGHIFEEGVTLDGTAPARRSTGLGLTLCKRVIEAHGGRIEVTTEPGRGTTFYFTLPNRAGGKG